jgi:hypothetical protein
MRKATKMAVGMAGFTLKFCRVRLNRTADADQGFNTTGGTFGAFDNSSVMAPYTSSILIGVVLRAGIPFAAEKRSLPSYRTPLDVVLVREASPVPALYHLV